MGRITEAFLRWSRFSRFCYGSWQRNSSPREPLQNPSWMPSVRIGMGCKASFAANSPAIGKKINAADRPRPNDSAPRGVLQRFPSRTSRLMNLSARHVATLATTSTDTTARVGIPVTTARYLSSSGWQGCPRSKSLHKMKPLVRSDSPTASAGTSLGAVRRRGQLPTFLNPAPSHSSIGVWPFRLTERLLLEVANDRPVG